MSKEQTQRLTAPCPGTPIRADRRLDDDQPACDQGHDLSGPATLLQEAPADRGACAWKEAHTRTDHPLAQADDGPPGPAACQHSNCNKTSCGEGCGGHQCDGACMLTEFAPAFSPRQEWVIGSCPRCQSPTVGNWYRVGGKGDRWLEQCWRSLVDWPACTFSRWLPGNPYPPAEQAA